jgi:hypothetical protein
MFLKPELCSGTASGCMPWSDNLWLSRLRGVAILPGRDLFEATIVAEQQYEIADTIGPSPIAIHARDWPTAGRGDFDRRDEPERR